MATWIPRTNCQVELIALWVALSRSGKFKLRWKRAVKRPRHINIGELRSFLKSEKLAKIKGKATRVVIGGDSQVALGCLLKGRSASRQLNRELQASLPHVLGGGLYSFFIRKFLLLWILCQTGSPGRRPGTFVAWTDGLNQLDQTLGHSQGFQT